MKKRYILPLALLFPLLSCHTRHVVQQRTVDSGQTDSVAVASAHIVRASGSSDATSLGAAFSSTDLRSGQQTEIDTSRTVVVTEFGADGLPVRQTETRQSGIVRQSSWNAEQQLQLDMYLMRLRAMNEWCDSIGRQMAELRKSFVRDSTLRDAMVEPVVSVPRRWTMIETVALLVVVGVPVWHVVRKMRKVQR